MDEPERQAHFRLCTRFLVGHGPALPHRSLGVLADEAGEDERNDAYGKGELIESFEAQVAALLGKPAAAFMPSGTMAQQIALRVWSERRGCATVAFHPTCHLELHEQRGYSFLHGLRAKLVGDRQSLLSRADLSAIAEPVAALLLELPQREIGGQLPSWEELVAQTDWARERGVALHLDGARLWEAQPFYDRPLSAIAARFDSVYVSFYKILGGLAGAALAGPEDFVASARVWQRRHGGNLVTQSPFLLSARAGLRDRLPRVPGYVERARTVAKVLSSMPGVRIMPDPPHTNMMHALLPGDPERLLDSAASIARDERVCLFTKARASGVPGISIVEIVIGDGAANVDDAVVEQLFRRLLGL